MRLDRPIALLGLLHASVTLAACSATYSPVSYTNHNGTRMTFNEQTVLKLSSDGKTPAVAVLDYGRNVEGFAFLDVARKSGNTSIFEMTYSETRALVNTGMVRSLAIMTTYLN